MDVQCHYLRWPATLLVAVLAGCGGNDVMNPKGPVTGVMGSRPGLQATAGQRWQADTLRELADITSKYERERSNRVAIERKLASLEKAVAATSANAAQSASALAASQKRVDALGATLAAAVAEVDRLKRELRAANKGLADTRAKLENEAARADVVELKLQTEVFEHVKTKNELAKLQIKAITSQLDKPDTPARPAAR